MKITATTSASPALTAIVENPFFDQQYSEHVLMYSLSEEQLPKIVKETKSFVLPCDPVIVKAKDTMDIKTGLTLIRKPRVDAD